AFYPVVVLQAVEMAPQGDRGDLHHLGQHILLDAVPAAQLNQHQPLGPGKTDLLGLPIEGATQQAGDVVEEKAETGIWSGFHKGAYNKHAYYFFQDSILKKGDNCHTRELSTC